MPHPPEDQNFISNAPVSKFVLFGEDDIDDEELLKELFSSLDSSLSLVFVNNGKQVIDFLYELPDDRLPALIILDYNMPGLNGADILRELQKQARFINIPKIIWSTSQTESYKIKCLDLGAADYIIKPSRVNDLVNTIKYMISFC